MRAKKKSKISFAAKFVLFCFALYAVVILIGTQKQIIERRTLIAELDAQIQNQQALNDSVRDTVEQGVSDDYIASIARDKLGYVYPGERVFVDASIK